MLSWPRREELSLEAPLEHARGCHTLSQAGAFMGNTSCLPLKGRPIIRWETEVGGRVSLVYLSGVDSRPGL